MAYFYRDGNLHIGSEKKSRLVADLATRSAAGGAISEFDSMDPVYIYDLDDIALRYKALAQALNGSQTKIHYAMKANSHPAILRLFARLGAGVDTVSAGEIQLALENGFRGDQVIFSGVGKTRKEIAFALTNNVKQLNVESPEELLRIAGIAKKLGVKAPIAFRLNPDVVAETHPYITTGFRENKFGMDASFLMELKAILRLHPGELNLRGLTMHIGSQLLELGALREGMAKLIGVYQDFVGDGYELLSLDVGGGIGVNYHTDDTTAEFAFINSYGLMIRDLIATAGIASENFELLVEPGRILVARSGLLVTEVQYIKKAPGKTFAILNSGMNHLLRPALYGAKHRALPLKKNSAPKNTAESAIESEYDLVGPICESADFLAKGIFMNELRSGDLLALADAGAYGYVMANHYNAHALPRQIAISIDEDHTT